MPVQSTGRKSTASLWVFSTVMRRRSCGRPIRRARASAGRARGGTGCTRRSTPLAWARVRSSASAAVSQSPASSAASSSRVSRIQARRTGRRHLIRDDAAELHDERGVRAGRPGHGAVDEARRPAGDRQGAQQVGVEGQSGRMLASGERAQRADQQQIVLDARLVLGQPVGRLDHGVRGGVARVVVDDVGAVRADRLGLLHDVEAAARCTTAGRRP